MILKKVLFTALDVSADKDGRWVIVSELENNKITFMSVYAPNMAQDMGDTGLVNTSELMCPQILNRLVKKWN